MQLLSSNKIMFEMVMSILNTYKYSEGKINYKFEKCNLHKVEAEQVNVAMIEESPVNIECKVREIHEYGSHHMFVADVVAVHADEKYMDENGRFALELTKPLAYSHGTYFGLTAPQGTFGYSVKKKGKKCNKK